MANVRFTVRHRFDHPPRIVWDELVDWAAHAAWIPATRVKVEAGDPLAIGARFTAWTGLGPLVLEDRMELVALDWNEGSSSGSCEVAKLGPILTGRAGFTIEPDGTGTMLEWLEDVTVGFLPSFLGPVVGKVGALGFAQGMKRMAKLLDRKVRPA
ncbi:MAG: SRPBCC family protein [Actinomycetota bacterium]|nr:SRPBCC family protein [Actinomycetota bacterium]